MKLRTLSNVGFAIGSLNVAMSTVNMGFYFSRPADQIEALEKASAYLQQYEGENPQDALDYAQQRLAVVNKEEIPRLSELERGITTVRNQVGNNSIANQRLLDNLGELIEYTAEHYDGGMNLLAGAVEIPVAGLVFGAAYLFRKIGKRIEELENKTP